MFATCFLFKNIFPPAHNQKRNFAYLYFHAVQYQEVSEMAVKNGIVSLESIVNACFLFKTELSKRSSIIITVKSLCSTI